MNDQNNDNRLFVGGLAYKTSEDALFDYFSEVGEVVSAKIVTDRDSGMSKGFGFVQMSDAESVAEAINRLNGTELDSRRITVSSARPREDRRQNSFGGSARQSTGYNDRY